MKHKWGRICIVSLVLAAPVAGAQQAVTFNIEPQPLRAALKEFSEQSGLQVMLRMEGANAEGMVAPKISGNLSPREALDQLLAQTGLSYQFVNEKTVRVAREESGALKTSDVGRGNDVSLQLAQGQGRLGAEVQKDGDGVGSVGPEGKEGVDTTLEEIVVTAQKRKERLQDVPISISVLTGRDLDRSTGQGVAEALSRVPGVAALGSVQGGTTQLAVRGVTANLLLGGGSSPIAYYLDSVPVYFVRRPFVPDANVYDLERVEVLRGPQGTLYGASAQNGVVRVLTRAADPSNIEFKARGSVSGTKGGGENYRGDAAFNLPIVQDKLAARAVVGYQDLSGWIDRPNQNRKDANDAEIRNMRLKVDATPTDELSIGLAGWASQSDFGAPSAANENDLHLGHVNEPIDSEFEAYSLGIGYEFPGFSVTSTTSYLDYSFDSFLDQGPSSGPVGGALLRTALFTRTVSQEVNLNSAFKGAWRWSLGGIYHDARSRLLQSLSTFSSPIEFTDSSESFAMYGELTRAFLDGRLELTGGVRYFEDEVGLVEYSRLNGAPPAGRFPDQDFSSTSPRVVLTWHPSSQLTAYASYGEGFRSGTQQTPVASISAPDLPPAKPDTLRNYELGSKGRLMNGLIDFDMALFYIDWQDVQQQITVQFPGGPPNTAQINAGSASGIGFEIALTTQPIDRLTFGVNYSWNDLQVDAHVLSTGNVLLFSKGDRLSGSSETTAGVSADYASPIGTSGLEARLFASANYVSAQTFRTIIQGTARIGQGDPTLIARTGFSIGSPDRWTVTLYGDNVTNEQDSPVRSVFFPDWDTRVRPRTVGLQLEYQFQ